MSVGANLLQLLANKKSQDAVSEDGARPGNFNKNIVRNFNLHVQNIEVIDKIIEEDESISNFESNPIQNIVKPELPKINKPPRKLWGPGPRSNAGQDPILSLLNEQEDIPE